MTITHTPEEAGKLVCPHSNLWESCCGAACMAWRWNGFTNDKGEVVKDSHYFRAEPETKKIPVSGYCKLIGE
jgi:hypothetical protein